MNYRVEYDTLGSVNVPLNKYWGAQTQRSVENFKIGEPGSMPMEIVRAYGYIKKAAAIVNHKKGLLSRHKMELITRVCDEINEGMLDDHFPLVIWQTGSGTHTNMNVNEVISNRAHAMDGGLPDKGDKQIHPNDDVNKSQSTNDTFSAAMHIAAYSMLQNKTIPAAETLKNSIYQKSFEYKDLVKVGRTHLMDATPLTLGQELSGYSAQLGHALEALRNTLIHLSELPLGGTAVGTGVNSPKGFDKDVVIELQQLTNFPFKPASNKFSMIAAHDAIVETHGALTRLAVSLMKIANDIRMLASGPRGGLGELELPSNEPGSSIMPGKVNPTQAEALTMVSAQVMGNDTTIKVSGSNGHFELNTFKPVIISNFLHSARLIADAMLSFSEKSIQGLKANENAIKKHLDNTLMLVTALNNHIGYDKASEIAKKAYNEGKTLREAALETGYLTGQQFDTWIRPENMTKPDSG
ncbi:MAG: class II fumarate hydratase [Bacteroidales bacterium]